MRVEEKKGRLCKRYLQLSSSFHSSFPLDVNPTEKGEKWKRLIADTLSHCREFASGQKEFGERGQLINSLIPLLNESLPLKDDFPEVNVVPSNLNSIGTLRRKCCLAPSISRITVKDQMEVCTVELSQLFSTKCMRYYTNRLRGLGNVTLNLSVNYRKFIRLGSVVLCECKLNKIEGKKTFVESKLISENGETVHSDATAIFYNTTKSSMSCKLCWDLLLASPKRSIWPC